MVPSDVPADDRLPPTAEVRGFVVTAYLRSARETSRTLGDRFEAQLAKRGIESAESDEWYSAREVQAVLYETADLVGPEALVDAGATAADLADWPEAVGSVGDALAELDVIWTAAHRDPGDNLVDGYAVESRGARTARVRLDRFAYPDPVARGLVAGTTRAFGSDPEAVVVADAADAVDARVGFAVEW
jgi:hypothetical protein